MLLAVDKSAITLTMGDSVFDRLGSSWCARRLSDRLAPSRSGSIGLDHGHSVALKAKHLEKGTVTGNRARAVTQVTSRPHGGGRFSCGSWGPGAQPQRSSRGLAGTLFQVHGGGDEGVAFQNRPDGRNQICGQARLENIAESTRRHRGLNKVVVGVHSQEDHLCY